jgi:uncharacterized membrane protein YjjB (DUF3815 family)
MTYAVQIIMAFFGSLSFALLYNIRGKKHWYAAIGGMLAWSVYLLLGLWLDSNVIQYLIAASLVTVYAEVLARITKTPTTTYLITAIIPLVPGSGLYYTMSYAFNGLWEKSISTGVYTMALSAALAAGIMVASSIYRLSMAMHRYQKKHSKVYRSTI